MRTWLARQLGAVLGAALVAAVVVVGLVVWNVTHPSPANQWRDELLQHAGTTHVVGAALSQDGHDPATLTVRVIRGDRVVSLTRDAHGIHESDPGLGHEPVGVTMDFSSFDVVAWQRHMVEVLPVCEADEPVSTDDRGDEIVRPGRRRIELEVMPNGQTMTAIVCHAVRNERHVFLGDHELFRRDAAAELAAVKRRVALAGGGEDWGSFTWHEEPGVDSRRGFEVITTTQGRDLTGDECTYRYRADAVGNIDFDCWVPPEASAGVGAFDDAVFARLLDIQKAGKDHGVVEAEAAGGSVGWKVQIGNTDVTHYDAAGNRVG